jgi:ribonuclease BN (tRNA processing enzyme)
LGRRAFLAGAIGSAAAAAWPRSAALEPRAAPLEPGAAAAQPSSTRLILLGTGGGPRPKRAVSAPAQVVLVNDVPYVIDCGDGVARQLVSAGVPLPGLRHVFVTHHHSDHNADYGALILLAWASGLRTRLDCWGPPPLAEMTRLFFQMNAFDIETRIADEGRVPLMPLVHAHDLSAGGLVLQDENVRVSAALVDHPPVVPAFAYRFDAADRSIVISGDTARSENLIRLALGADVLVHEALWVPAVDRLVAQVPNASTLKEHIIASHTSAEDCGRVAEAAGVRTLVLSHLVPSDDPSVTDQMWIDAARAHFRGNVIVAKDLMEI